MRLLRPWEEEATIRPVLQAVLRRALVGVLQLNLDSSRQARDTQDLGVRESTPIGSRDVWSNHFTENAATFEFVVDRVFVRLEFPIFFA